MKTLEQVEKEYILEVLEKCKGNKVKAAKVLDVSVKTLYNKLNRWENETINHYPDDKPLISFRDDRQHTAAVA